MDAKADPAPPPFDLAQLTVAVLAAEPITVSADAEFGDVEHEARLVGEADWQMLCALLRSLDDCAAPSRVANGSDLCPLCRGTGTHLDVCTALLHDVSTPFSSAAIAAP